MRRSPTWGSAQGEHHHQYIETRIEQKFDKDAVVSILIIIDNFNSKFFWLILYLNSNSHSKGRSADL